MINYRKMAEYLTALADAQDAVEAGKCISEPVEVSAPDIAMQKLMASNVAIAGSGVKAELCGTIEGEPTATVEKLMEIGFYEEQARELIAVGASVRADAIALTADVIPIGVSPIKEV